MEEEHPDIYSEGPTDEMYEKWDAEWGDKRSRWTGLWPGYLECFEQGLFCRDLCRDGRIIGTTITMSEALDRRNREPGFIRWHVTCGPDDEGAHPDLNRLATPQGGKL